MVDLCRHFRNAYSSFIICFGSVEDPRVSALVTYQFEEILFATLCGVVAGCDDLCYSPMKLLLFLSYWIA